MDVSEHDFTVKAQFSDGSKLPMTFMQEWISAESPTDPGIDCDLTCGAGLGNPLLRATVRKGELRAVAQIDVRELAQSLWRALERALDEQASRATGS